MNKIKRWIQKFFEILGKSEMRVLPGNLAFFLVLTIIPIITLIGYVGSLFHISIDSLMNAMNDVLPEAVTNVLVPLINGQGINTNVIIFMITGFIVASNGAHSLIISSNTLYKFPHKNFLQRRIKSFLLTILLVGNVVFTMIILAFGNTILKTILSLEVFADVSTKVYQTFIYIKWPVAFLFLFFFIKLLFIAAPDAKIPSKTVNKGAFFTTLGWMVVTAIYSYYVSNFANYDRFYGGLSSIVVLMIWLYILSYIVVLGIAMNANDYDLVKTNTNTDA